MSTPTRLTAAAASIGQIVHMLESQVRGAVHVPGDEGYESQREGFRGSPAIVVEADNASDVQATVLAAREHNLSLTVLSTGHGTLLPNDGGVLLKTSGMAQVLIDPDRMVAHVGPGVRWSEVIAAAEPFGLAPLSGDTPSVGVAGYTLGGGFSWLSRKYGFAADSLLKAELVTADGRVITADAKRTPDLFWAIRGGSGNFGVVTALEFRLYRVPTVYAGTAVFPIERAQAALTYLARHADDIPDELSLSMVVSAQSPVPEVDGPALIVRGVYAGDEEGGRDALRPLFDAAGTPVVDGFRTMNYSGVAGVGGTAPIGLAMFEDLSEVVISKLISTVTSGNPAVQAIEVKHWGGAIANPTHDNPGPVSHRDARFVMKLAAMPDAVADITAHATGGAFLNFLHDTTKTSSAYTERNYRRLREIKAIYDPANVFHGNHNIPPAGR